MILDLPRKSGEAFAQPNASFSRQSPGGTGWAEVGGRAGARSGRTGGGGARHRRGRWPTPLPRNGGVSVVRDPQEGTGEPPLCDPGHGEAVTQIPGDARQLARTIGGARGEAGEGTVHVDPRLGRWARRCRTFVNHRASRQASTVDLSIEIGAGQGTVQGRDRI